MGHVVNLSAVDYDCLAWDPVSDSSLACDFNWHPLLMMRSLGADDFPCTGQHVRDTLERGLLDQERLFLDAMNAPNARTLLEAAVQTLDPSQHEVYQIVTDWAQKRFQWEATISKHRRHRKAPAIQSEPPSLEFLLLGTAGTGGGGGDSWNLHHGQDTWSPTTAMTGAVQNWSLRHQSNDAEDESVKEHWSSSLCAYTSPGCCCKGCCGCCHCDCPCCCCCSCSCCCCR